MNSSSVCQICGKQVASLSEGVKRGSEFYCTKCDSWIRSRIPQTKETEVAPAVICPSCKKDNPQDSQYCAFCGYELKQPSELLCDKCGEKNSAECIYCISCGNCLRESQYALNSSESILHDSSKTVEEKITCSSRSTSSNEKGYSQDLTATWFKKDNNGRTVFYRWGVLGKGYILSNSTIENQIRTFVKRYLIISLISSIVGIKLGGWKLGVLLLLVLYLWYYLGTRRFLIGLPIAKEKLKISDVYVTKSVVAQENNQNVSPANHRDEMRPTVLGESSSEQPRKENVRQENYPDITRPAIVTPILLCVNIGIFLLMVMSGINIVHPSLNGLILWGANYKPLTLDGQWWRLVTNCFVHIGVIHLSFNMYALWCVGSVVEGYLGRPRFLSAYLLSGVCGSIVSLWWHDNVVSAGASGAIFGIYGVFIFMLLANMIKKEISKDLLGSSLAFVGYNLLYGMKAGIDNAAHIGGLIGGFIFGFVFLKRETICYDRSHEWSDMTLNTAELVDLNSPEVLTSNIDTFCTQCGSNIESFNQFCINCGRKLH